MFKDRKNTPPAAQRKNSTQNSSAVTIITAGCEFSGKLHCRGASRIGGEIEGEIVSEGLLIIEEEARIHAAVVAEEVVIQGKMQGKLKANHRVEICATGSFEGDIECPSLIVHEGAVFNGNTKMSKPAEVKSKQSFIKPYAGKKKKQVVNPSSDVVVDPVLVKGGASSKQPEVTIN